MHTKRPLHAVAFFLALVPFVLSDSSTGELEPSDLSAQQPKLLFVAELCRHGDRTPLAQFPSDALPAYKWPEGIGELTAIGQRAHYELGKRLRQRYVDTGFLPEAYSPRDVYVRSTDIDRTLVSATSQMTGLYPPGTAANTDVRVRFGNDPLHENEGGLPHLFQPVPVHTQSKDNDMLLLPDHNCPRQDRNLHHMYKAPEFREKVRQERHFLRTLAKIAKVDPDTFTVWNAERLSDTWTVFQHHSVPLPEKATPDIVAHARNLSYWLITYMNQGIEQNRLRGGLILYTVSEYMAMAALKYQRRLPLEYQGDHKKFVLLSAHDTTVTATLSALQAFDGINPPYNSTLIWEFYVGHDDAYFIKVEYNGNPVLLPGCSDVMCPVIEYIQSTAKRTVEGEFKKNIECMVGFGHFAALVNSWFRKLHPKENLINLAFSPDDQNDESGSSVVTSIIAVVCGFLVLIGAVGIASRMRSRYNGYVRANDASIDAVYRQPIMQDVVSDRRILM
ncbi:Prostatic acid phosphatase [Gracilariopsis chorda]|uniref:Prostatic acid phosphatase n=1 Tax=Gracilariopsis chorda TaxID=448386 RepID=A0A2V3IJ38_9FLOR|nr:Prostatic acid phosphatase [Gracilariopsis chorda]|eukprot:PXF42081.1 Prostatic acid phosphatase [Gracilariopsis chorda]